jgi:hypothetical protein
MNPSANNNSTSIKKRFEKLIDYHIKHADSELESITKKDIKDDGFHLGEHHSHPSRPNGFEKEIVVHYDKNTDAFYLTTLIDGKEVLKDLRSTGWKGFLKTVEKYMWLPDEGTLEYDDLLTESLTTLPSKLYHATYRQFLNSIKKKGLGNTKKKMWSDSKPGVVYLADDPWVAESYAEESEYIDSVEDPDDYLDNIIILEVVTSKLDSSKLYIDENVLLDADEEGSTWEYHGIIPWEAIKIFDSSIAKDFEVYNTLWK